MATDLQLPSASHRKVAAPLPAFPHQASLIEYLSHCRHPPHPPSPPLPHHQGTSPATSPFPTLKPPIQTPLHLHLLLLAHLQNIPRNPSIQYEVLSLIALVDQNVAHRTLAVVSLDNAFENLPWTRGPALAKKMALT